MITETEEVTDILNWCVSSEENIAIVALECAVTHMTWKKWWATLFQNYYPCIFFYMKMIFAEQGTCNRALNFSIRNSLKSLGLTREEEKELSRDYRQSRTSVVCHTTGVL